MSVLSAPLAENCCQYFTIGYSGRTQAEFVRALRFRRVATLVDIRNTPLSRHRPEFSKNSLSDALQAVGIAYVHLPELGVPKPVREQLSRSGDYEAFFAWYDKAVAPRLVTGTLARLQDFASPPYAFMCTEKDHGKCHRSRVSAALRRLGWLGFEIG